MNIAQIPAIAMTHGGKFHADDVFSGAFLRLLKPEIQIRRAFKVPESFEGLVFDLGWGCYDHHQQGAPVRENGIPYAAFGLLWKEFGKEYLSLYGLPQEAEKEALFFDLHFVQPLDLDDNTGCGTPLADVIGNFNPPWDSADSPDSCYEQAVEFAKTILNNHFRSVFASQRASALVREALQKIENHIVVLDTYCPWKQVLAGTDTWFVVYPSQRGGYSAQTVPSSQNEGGSPIDFPEAWAGKSAEELQQLTSISDLRFCHNSRFLIAADSLDGALQACRLAMEAGEKKL